MLLEPSRSRFAHTSASRSNSRDRSSSQTNTRGWLVTWTREELLIKGVGRQPQEQGVAAAVFAELHVAAKELQDVPPHVEAVQNPKRSRMQ